MNNLGIDSTIQQFNLFNSEAFKPVKLLNFKLYTLIFKLF